jgi:tripartite-type tricarboxylate transporter receptor subunit TctC
MKQILSILLLVFAAAHSHAQTAFPTGPVRIVVPYPPGAITDTLPRMIAEKLREEWGQPVVIDNRPGAGGRIATEFVAKSAPDGHTLIVALPDTLVIAPQLYKKNSYTIRDFAPVTMMARQSFVLVVRQDLNVNKFSDLIELAKSKPGQIKMSSWGEGSVGHLALELLKQKSGVNIVHIPYKGAQAALTDVIGGQVDMMITGYSTAGPHVKTGRIKILARTSSNRSPQMPDIPSINESGIPGYEVQSWYGLAAPAQTPPAIIDKIQRSVAKAMSHPAIVEKMQSYAADIVASRPDEFSKLLQDEQERWAAVLQKANIQLD